jgi:hypothetical protein
MTSSSKYIGMDVHKESTSIGVRNASKIVIESVIRTKANIILDFINGPCGEYPSPSRKEAGPPGCGLLNPHVMKLVVCDPR